MATYMAKVSHGVTPVRVPSTPASSQRKVSLRSVAPSALQVNSFGSVWLCDGSSGRHPTPLLWLQVLLVLRALRVATILFL